MNSSSLRSDPQRPKRPSAIARTTMLRRWVPRQCEATCVLRNLLFQQLCGTKKPQRQYPKKQLLRNNSAARQSIQKLAQKISRARRWCWAREREFDFFFASVVSQMRSYGHCLCDSALHSSWDSICVVRWSLRNAGRTLPIN